MTQVTQYHVNVMFGDCDPAGIVFFPNFSKWMDAASHHYFHACGVPPWRELYNETRLIGTPLLEIHTKFYISATYGQSLVIHTQITSWGRKTFEQLHQVYRGDTLLCEGTETRIFVIRPNPNGDDIQSIAVPQWIKDKCQ